MPLLKKSKRRRLTAKKSAAPVATKAKPAHSKTYAKTYAPYLP